MKKHVVFMLFVAVVYTLFAGLAMASTGTGKVTAVDPEGKAIVVDVGSGKQALTVGAIVNQDTKLQVKGKKTALSDLQKNVKPGDTVTLKWDKSNDLYAKEIIKK